MVLCLMTLTDLKTRRAGLSASAELLAFHSCYLLEENTYSLQILNARQELDSKV